MNARGADAAQPNLAATQTLKASQALRLRLLCRLVLRAPAMGPSTMAHTSMTLTSSQLEQGVVVCAQRDGLPPTMVCCAPLRPLRDHQAPLKSHSSGGLSAWDSLTQYSLLTQARLGSHVQGP